MGDSAILSSRTASKEIDNLPARSALQVLEAIGALGEQPRTPGYKQLSGTESVWRTRIGNHRVIDEIHAGKRTILVTWVRQRRHVDRD
jgi:mRNA-degrading endonuclease RelE of RelBE toxin-antitoxin system